MTSEFRNAGARNVTAVGLVWCPSDGHSLSIAFESFENRQILTGSTAQAINSAVKIRRPTRQGDGLFDFGAGICRACFEKVRARLMQKGCRSMADDLREPYVVDADPKTWADCLERKLSLEAVQPSGFFCRMIVSLKRQQVGSFATMQPPEPS